ncbi:unnamed protein product, partial [Nesidiocoris tenuis]
MDHTIADLATKITKNRVIWCCRISDEIRGPQPFHNPHQPPAPLPFPTTLQHPSLPYLHLHRTPPFVISVYAIKWAARRNVLFPRTESQFPGIRNLRSG